MLIVVYINKYSNVKVSYPLKQGLKQFLRLFNEFIFQVVKVSYPLKQGLKQ